ncbi:MAG: MarR family transcriptional regulator [Pirellula sp.]|nr:MarR family transcriptional regulator [Pirellula sp.]
MELTKLPMALRTAYFTLHRETDSCFSDLGITADQFVLLATLDREQAVSQRELAKRMPSDPSTVRAMLVLLENQGLVVREPHPSDARAKSVSLTDDGRKKFQQLWAASESIRQSMSSALNEKEYRILVKLLNQVTETLSNQTTQPVLGQGR